MADQTHKKKSSGGGDGGASRKAALPQTDATSDPGVKKFLEAFGGSKIVGIE